MLKEPLIINAVVAQTIDVSPANQGTCQSCQLKPACGQQLLQAMRGKRQIFLPDGLLRDTALTGLKAGQKAMLEIPGSSLVKLALLLYLAPLLLMLPVTLLCEMWNLSESTTVIAGFTALGLSFATLHHYLPVQSLSAQMKLTIDPRSSYDSLKETDKVMNHENTVL